jgi:hypothetical protein
VRVRKLRRNGRSGDTRADDKNVERLVGHAGLRPSQSGFARAGRRRRFRRSWKSFPA